MYTEQFSFTFRDFKFHLRVSLLKIYKIIKKLCHGGKFPEGCQDASEIQFCQEQ